MLNGSFRLKYNRIQGTNYCESIRDPWKYNRDFCIVNDNKKQKNNRKIELQIERVYNVYLKTSKDEDVNCQAMSMELENVSVKEFCNQHDGFCW